MPILGTDDLQQVKNGNFGYSATKLNNLAAAEYTLVTIANDNSGSVSGFKAEMEVAIREAIAACSKSPRVDNLMIRHITFDNKVDETLGFTLYGSLDLTRFDNCLNPHGSTALNDGFMNAISATDNYAETLTKADYNVNGLVILITDGCGTHSSATPGMIKDALHKARTAERLESLFVIVVGVNIDDAGTARMLQQWAVDCGLDMKTEFVALKDASKNTLAKLAKFISHSISSSSQALGTKGPSQQLASGSLQQSLTI